MSYFLKLHICFLIFPLLFLLYTGPFVHAQETNLKDSEERGKNILSTPQQAFNTLIETIISGDIKGYELLLNRPLNEKELNQIDYIKNKRPESRITKISLLQMLSRGYKGKGENRLFCIEHEVELLFVSGPKDIRFLETCFRKRDGMWIYVPKDVRLFQ